jgi:hypothetical protein
MLILPSEIISSAGSQAFPESEQKAEIHKKEPSAMVSHENHFAFVDDHSKVLTKAIGEIENGKTIHYYSYGNFNLVRLILHLIKQTGPVHLFMTSYSISRESIEQLQLRIQQNLLLSFRLIIDNRVRTMSPKPFQMLAACFNYRCSSIHAKVALLWNNDWNISIVTSQNATNNPKMERGTIHTARDVFQFDLNALENEFDNATT